jgi:hypothetical protein
MATRRAISGSARVWLRRSRTTLHSSHTTSTSAGCGRITVERLHSGASFSNACDGARCAPRLQQQTGSTRLDPSELRQLYGVSGCAIPVTLWPKPTQSRRSRIRTGDLSECKPYPHERRRRFSTYVSRATCVLSSVTFTTPLGAIKLGHPIVPCGERFGDVDAVLFGGSQPPRAIRV